MNRLNELYFYYLKSNLYPKILLSIARVCLKTIVHCVNRKWQRYTQRLKRRCQLIIPCCDSTEMLDFIEKHSTKWRSLYKYQSTFQGAFAFDLGGMV